MLLVYQLVLDYHQQLIHCVHRLVIIVGSSLHYHSIIRHMGQRIISVLVTYCNKVLVVYYYLLTHF